MAASVPYSASTIARLTGKRFRAFRGSALRIRSFQAISGDVTPRRGLSPGARLPTPDLVERAKFLVANPVCGLRPTDSQGLTNFEN